MTTIGSLFTGYGGLDMAVEAVFAGRTSWMSDIDPGACKIIDHRYPHIPNLGDITGIDWVDVEPVDVLTGGFPCQDLSAAGRRAGLRPGTRSGLWQHMAYAIAQLRPRYVIAENVRGLLNGPAHSDVEPCPWCLGDRPDGHLRALGAVLGDLANLGYDACWYGLRAADVGAPHGRFRVFIVATDAENLGHERIEAARFGWPGPANGGDGAVALLPTPRATRGGSGTETMYGLGAQRDDSERPQGQVLLPTPLVGSTSLAAHGQISGQFRRDMENALARFGDYALAIDRWEPIVGRPAPAPTIDGRLSPQFVEWMMGLPEGWVTDVPGLKRNQQLKALGNGVVPQQAAAALAHMINLDRPTTAAGTSGSRMIAPDKTA
jgi:DNA (cytosine-5)-methyltransferase 1